MNTALIYYFGYGANADPVMMEAITGKSGLVGKPAVLMDHRLGIQRLDQVPTNPRKILEEAWGPDFRTYVAIPERGPRINGIIWKIDEAARKLIRNWELVEEEVGPELAWRKEAHPSSVLLPSGGGSVYGIQTEVLGDSQTYDESITVDENYPFYLMPRETVLKAAILERETYLARTEMEGRPPAKER